MAGEITEQLQAVLSSEFGGDVPGDALYSLWLDSSVKSARPRSRCDETMDTIKAYIIREGLGPGDPLPTENELVGELGASRSSVREAIRKLEALRIVQVVHGRGMFVGDLSLEPLMETLAFRATTLPGENCKTLWDVIQFRRAIDMGTAEVVVAALQGTDPAELSENIQRMRQSAAAGQTFLADDIRFHTHLLGKTGNEVLTQVARSLWLVHMSVLPRLGLQVSAELVETAESHQTLLDAAVSGDVDKYREAVASHYEPIEAIVRSELS